MNLSKRDLLPSEDDWENMRAYSGGGIDCEDEVRKWLRKFGWGLAQWIDDFGFELILDCCCHSVIAERIEDLLRSEGLDNQPIDGRIKGSR